MNKKLIIAFLLSILTFVLSNVCIRTLNAEILYGESVNLPDTSTEKPAEEVFKNVQVLKGLPANKLFSVMGFMAASLGVRCDFCHVTSEKGPWPMEKDDKETKLTARKMITMMNNINRDNFEGKQVVNCASCHNGNSKPRSVPPFFTKSNVIPVSKDTLPEANLILERYFNAIGGKAAYEKIKTRVIEGEATQNGMFKMKYESFQSAPDKYMTSTESPKSIFQKGYDGSTGWVKTQGGVFKMKDDDLEEIKADGDFYHDIELDNIYPGLKSTGMQMIGDRKTYEIGGTDNSGNYAKMYFDTDSGLLVRMIIYKKTPFGAVPEEKDFDDYRDIDGVKLPFTVTDLGTNYSLLIKITSIKNNVTIDESKFVMPEK